MDVESICQDLRRRILVQGFTGDQAPGEDAQVRHYGVSHRTVRQAVDQPVTEGLLIRRPHRPCRVRPGAAAVLARRSLLTKICLVVSHIRESSFPFAHHVANGANRRAETMGIEFQMRRLRREEGLDKADVIRAAEPARHTTGWILIHPSLTNAVLESWLLGRAPFVVADQVPTVLRVNAVAFDSEEAVGLASEHLIEPGHRRLGCIGAMRGDPVSEGRQRGFRTAMEKQGLPVRPEWMLNEMREPVGADAADVSCPVAYEHPPSTFPQNLGQNIPRRHCQNRFVSGTLCHVAYAFLVGTGARTHQSTKGTPRFCPSPFTASDNTSSQCSFAPMKLKTLGKDAYIPSGDFLPPARLAIQIFSH